MVKILKTKIFACASSLVSFVNADNIKQKDIQQIAETTDNSYLYYWSEDN